MALVSSQEEHSFSCSVCFELLWDPVTIPCGHICCMGCIKSWWDQEDGKGEYSCPLCKHTFDSRPILNKNRLMAEMVEKFGKTRIQAAARCYAGPGDVACDICSLSMRKLKAVKSCLDCVMSFCDSHLKAHNELIGINHTKIGATAQLHKRVCRRHKKVFETFCRTDQSCICYLCMVDDHKDHDTITTMAEWSHKKEELVQSQRRGQQIIQLKQMELKQELRKAFEALKTPWRRHSEVTELIRAQEKDEVSRAEELLKRLELEIAELKRTDAEMTQLSQTQDPIYFLKNMVSMTGDPCSDVTRLVFSQSHIFELLEEPDSISKQEIVNISAAVSDGQAPIGEPLTREDFLQNTDPEPPVRREDRDAALTMWMQIWMWTRMMLCVSVYVCVGVCVVSLYHMITDPGPEPVTREDFLKYSCYFTLDPNTAHCCLRVPEGNRLVEAGWWPGGGRGPQRPGDHPDRFDGQWYQVLCKEGVSARSYWEFEWSGWVGIAVSYKSISRKGDGNDCGFGGNKQSWSLDVGSGSFLWHRNTQKGLGVAASSRIGVYVDYWAGVLAFYSIRNDTMTLMHRINTTFTQALYPGFRLYCSPLSTPSSPSSSVKLL